MTVTNMSASIKGLSNLPGKVVGTYQVRRSADHRGTRLCHAHAPTAPPRATARCAQGYAASLAEFGVVVTKEFPWERAADEAPMLQALMVRARRLLEPAPRVRRAPRPPHPHAATRPLLEERERGGAHS